MRLNQNGVGKGATVHVVSEYVSGGQNSTGYYISKIIVALSRRYDRVSVTFLDAQDVARDVLALANVRLCPVFAPSLGKDHLFSRLLRQSITTILFSLSVIRKVRKGEVLCSSTNPALFLLACAVLRRAIGFRWLLIAYDVFPENVIGAGILSPRNLTYRIAKRMFDWAYRCADSIVTIGRDMQALMEQKTRRARGIVFIPNWADPEAITPIDKSQARVIQQLGWTDKVVFQFFGNLGRVQGIANLLEAIKACTNRDAAFLFAGDGAMSDTIQQFIADHPTLPVAHIGAVSMKESNQILAGCDVALVSLSENMLGLGVPSKAYFSMAADKPIVSVGHEESEISRVVREAGIGWTCPPGDPKRLARLFDDISLTGVAQLAGKPRKVLMTKYSEAAALKKYIARVDDLVACTEGLS